MNDIIKKLYQIGIVPVIAIDDAKKAVPLAKALVKDCKHQLKVE